MKRIILISLMTLFCFAFLSADIYVKSNTHSDAFKMMGQETPAKDDVSEVWIGKDKFANVTSAQKLVVDLGAKKLYIIYDATKSYVETELPLDITKILPEQTKAMMAMMKFKIKVNPTGETKKIGKWNCSGFDVAITGMMNMNTRVWATKDVDFDYAAYNQNVASIMMKSTMAGLGDELYTEMKKMDGFQIASETNMSMMGTNMKITTEVVEITEKAAPAGVYTVPAGYKKQAALTNKKGM
jgi:hypothetical protein